MKKTLTALLALTTISLAVGCAINDEETIDTVGQKACSNPEGIYGMQASLAVATANELGRWDGMQDYVCSGGKLALTAAGQAQCAARGGCPNVQAILEMQSTTWFENGIGWMWDGPIFASRTCDAWTRLRDASLRGASDPNHCYGVAHTLTLDHLDAGVCALNNWYQVGGLPAGSTAADLKCQMELFANDNPWINFQTANGLVGVDPEAGMIADPLNPSLMCWDAQNGYIYDPSPKTKVGQCCVVAGVTKTLYSYSTTLDKCR